MTELDKGETKIRTKTRLRGWARALPVAATGLLVLVLLGVGVTSAHPVNASALSGDTILAKLPGVTALAATPFAVFASGSNCSQVWSVSPSGTVTLYAEVPVPVSSCGEGALVVGPGTSPSQGGGSDSNGYGQYGGGYGGYGHGFTLYYAVESTLFAITNSGSTVTKVASFPLAPNLDLSVTYDQVGTFYHDVIVVGQGGTIWLVTTGGTVTKLTDLKTHTEGPAVAPLNFGTYGGDLLAAEQDGSVVAVTPSGTVSTVASWKYAEDVLFPTTYGNGHCQNSNSANGVLLVANEANGTIEEFPASELNLASNVGIVDGEFNNGVASFSATGAVTPIAGGSPDLEQMAWTSSFCYHHQGCGNGGKCGNQGCGNGNGCKGNHSGRGKRCQRGESGGRGW